MKQYAVLALGVVAVAFAAIFIRLAQTPPLVTAAYRLGIAAILLAPVAWWRSGSEIRRLRSRQFWLALASGAFLALHFALWIASLDYTTVATSVVLVTASPIFVAVASYFLFREKLNGRIIAGIAVSVAGAVVIGYSNLNAGQRSLAGPALALGGALAVSGYLLIGRRLRRDMGLLTYIFLAYSSAATLLLAAAFISGQRMAGYPPQTYLLFALLAVVPQLLGHSALNWSLRFVPATMVTIAVLGEPVGSTVLAIFILKEVPSVTEVVGAVLILVGIALAFSRTQSAASGQQHIPPGLQGTA
jgi:drug/metabolite transporter (DMT)-like permease